MAIAGKMAEDAFHMMDVIMGPPPKLLLSANHGADAGPPSVLEDEDDDRTGRHSLLWLWPAIVDLLDLFPRASPRWWVMRRSGGLWKDLLPVDDAQSDHYISLLQMRRSTFDRLLRRVGPSLEKQVTRFRLPLPAAKKLAYALHRWAHDDAHRHSCSGYGLGKTSGLHAVREVAEAIIASYPHVIGFGGHEERHARMNVFAQEGFPNCWGCIDCTHVYMDKPRARDGDDYCSGRNKRFSVVAQVVVDYDLKILDFRYGFPGTVGNARVLKHTSLYRRALKGTLFLDEEGDPFRAERPVIPGVPGWYLLGDGGYPSIPWLMTPYGQQGNVTRNMQVFDSLHKIVQSCVEHFFGVFKTRFQFFYRPHVADIKREGLEFHACCILHNLLQPWGDVPEQDSDDSDGCSPPVPPPEVDRQGDGHPLDCMFGRERGQAMRDALCAEVVRLYDLRWQ
ncbi:hypothetical protein CBR_g6642 [Chara braunii]|uniref:DDE Tnp4 domain-containing protein n=1 Tax=Chara braunii TaxID=69332 RepID=A0A388KKD7_CHABU|nr:hypothetical protein CBR_g6642 [Chara braunii]|eukprot:GBG70514.1 hypothetical protein CBR_g6642 [Chara braunii]